MKFELVKMTQKLLLELIKVGALSRDDGPLTVCKNCLKLVPKTMLCLYCGAHILYKKLE
jgi:hypothetical protein